MERRGILVVAVAALAIQMNCADHNLAGAVELPRARTVYVAGVRVLRQSGGRVSWGRAKDLIAYDVLGTNGYYEIHIMRPDGSEDSCLTCGKPGLPQRHNGQPEWHPSGDYSLRSAHSYYRNIRLRVESVAGTHHPLAPSYPRFLNHRLRPREHAELVRERQDELPDRHVRDDAVHQMGASVGHSTAGAARAHAAALT